MNEYNDDKFSKVPWTLEKSKEESKSTAIVLKANEITIPEDNPLASFKTLNIGASLADLQVKEIIALPYIKFSYHTKNYIPLTFVKDKKEEDLQEDALIVSCCIRNTIRRLKGKVYTNRYYMPSEEKTVEYRKYIELREECKESKNLNEGVTHLLLLKRTTSKIWDVVTFEAFKSVQQYFLSGLLQAESDSGKAVKLSIANHSCNMVTSANGWNYLSGRKFNQYEIIDLNLQEIEVIQACLKFNKAGIESFLNR